MSANSIDNLLEKNLQEIKDKKYSQGRAGPSGSPDSSQGNELRIPLGSANRNRAALHMLTELGFSMSAIRKALLVLNGIKLKHLSFDKDVITDASIPTICRTIKGHRGNKTAQFMIAGALGLTMSELFPKDSDNCNNEP